MSGLLRSRFRTIRAFRTAAVPDQPAVRHQPQRVRPGQQRDQVDERRRRRHARVRRRRREIHRARAHGFTFQGGTSTGKVTNDWCEVRAAVPESYLLNPYCNVESPWQTSFRALVELHHPTIDVLVSRCSRTSRTSAPIRSARWCRRTRFTAADIASAAAQFGRPLTNTGAPGEPARPGRIVRRSRFVSGICRSKKIIRFGGQRLTAGVDMYNLMNNNVTLRSTRRSCRIRRGGSRRSSRT